MRAESQHSATNESGPDWFLKRLPNNRHRRTSLLLALVLGEQWISPSHLSWKQTVLVFYLMMGKTTWRWRFLLEEEGEKADGDDGAMVCPSEERSESADQLPTLLLYSSHQADQYCRVYWDSYTWNRNVKQANPLPLSASQWCTYHNVHDCGGHIEDTAQKLVLQQPNTRDKIEYLRMRTKLFPVGDGQAWYGQRETQKA